jgi:endonuclease/exonuclease/phosphatase family metal-dependent hydrolase
MLFDDREQLVPDAPPRRHLPTMEPLEDRQMLASVTVMTQNVYYGGGSSLDAFATAFTDLWDTVEQSRIPDRAARIAKQIRREKPDLVALQEAVVWRTGSPLSSSSAGDVQYDFVASLLDRLSNGKARYQIVSRATNADWEFPARVGSSIRDVRMTDQDVILARVGRGSRLRILDDDHGNYRHRFAVDVPVIDDALDFTRGWASVDARVGRRGPKFRFINTHLEVFNTSIRNRQARALLDGPADTRRPVIIAGDFNAGPGATTYRLLTDTGLDDAWAQARPRESGPTCCQDDDLRNERSRLSSRIDLILFDADDFDATAAERVGHARADRTPTGLWPSDHAGLVARLRFE